MALLLRISSRTSFGALEKSLATLSVAVLQTSPMFFKCNGMPPCRRLAMTAWGDWACQKRQYGQRPVGRSSPGALSRSDSESDSDSDSDDGKKRIQRGNSEFWRRKMRTFHRLIDLNNDGVVSFDDFKLLAERFINLGHLTPPQQEEFQLALKVVWEDQWGKVHPYNLVTTEQYLENMHHIVNDPELRRKAHHFLPHLFKALDKDKNGSISVEEYKLFFECLGLTREEATKSFKIIDRNRDGCLSLKEFVSLGREYFFVENEEHPSKVFWGPLIKP